METERASIRILDAKVTRIWETVPEKWSIVSLFRTNTRPKWSWVIYESVTDIGEQAPRTQIIQHHEGPETRNASMHR